MNPISAIFALIALLASSFASFLGGHPALGVLFASASVVPMLFLFAIGMIIASFSINGNDRKRPTDSEIKARETKIHIVAALVGVLATVLGVWSFKSFAKGRVGTGTALALADVIPILFSTGVLYASLKK